MPGKPYQSKLKPFEREIRDLLDAGQSYRKVAGELNRRHGLQITHNAVYSFIKSRGPTRGKGRLFYEGFPPDIRNQLIKRVVAEWTHDSTAIEGNTLTLGETVQVLELGLTISGKPLKEHQEVYGHARAVDLLYEMIHRPVLTQEDIFNLHRAVMQKTATDAMHPVGDWKRDYNGVTGVANGQTVYMEYAAPDDVPHLMQRWIEDFNRSSDCRERPDRALAAYARTHITLVRIHPFFDGNGRMARLLANLPVLRAGYPPIVVPAERRGEYIEMMWNYEYDTGRIKRGSMLYPPHPAIKQFEKMLNEAWSKTVSLVDEARRRRKDRGL